MHSIVDNNLTGMFHQSDTSVKVPDRPYCSDLLHVEGIYRKPVKEALKQKYIQVNPSNLITNLVLDLDYPDSLFSWEDVGLPPPNLAVVNSNNAHTHLFYSLAYPVPTTSISRTKPLNYLAAIEASYKLGLKADLDYRGFIAKTPFHPKWQTYSFYTNPYSLDELADSWVMNVERPAIVKEKGVGRNVSLFESLRKWASRAMLKCFDVDYVEWYQKVCIQAMLLNNFDPPLSSHEIKSISKSVARWYWRNFSRERFEQIQSHRGQRKGRDKRQDGMELMQEGWSDKEVAEAVDVSRRTVRNWRKRLDEFSS